GESNDGHGGGVVLQAASMNLLSSRWCREADRVGDFVERIQEVGLVTGAGPGVKSAGWSTRRNRCSGGSVTAARGVAGQVRSEGGHSLPVSLMELCPGDEGDVPKPDMGLCCFVLRRMDR